MKMKITEAQIDKLYKFTRQHYVYHYDVQTELVDHLANDIETIWEEHPKLTFEQARDKSFKKFGIFGFMDVIEAKQKQMNKRYWSIIWRFVKEWFTVPKILVTLSLIASLFFILTIKYSEFILLGAILILAVFDVIKQFKRRKQEKKLSKGKNQKIFLLEAMIGQTKDGFAPIALINIFNTINLTRVSFHNLENHWLLLIAAGTIILSIFFYVSNYVIPQKAQELLEETYPEYKMVKKL